MTDEQFKTWAVDFFDRIEMIHSWREAAAEAIKMIEYERTKNKQLIEALECLYNDTKAEHGIHEDDILLDSSSLGQAKEALSNFRSKDAV